MHKEICVLLSYTFSVVLKQRTNFLDHQQMASGNCIYFVCKANWSFTAQLHSDSVLNSKHNTNMMSFSPTVCLLQRFKFIFEYRSGWNPIQLEFQFTALLWPVSGTKHRSAYACMQILCCILQHSRNQQNPELRFSILSYFSCPGCMPYGKDFFITNTYYSGPCLSQGLKYVMLSWWAATECYIFPSFSGSCSAQAKSRSKGSITY